MLGTAVGCTAGAVGLALSSKGRADACMELGQRARLLPARPPARPDARPPARPHRGRRPRTRLVHALAAGGGALGLHLRHHLGHQQLAQLQARHELCGAAWGEGGRRAAHAEEGERKHENGSSA